MFALILVSAYLLPLLYMVTTAFQQPGQASTPGAPSIPPRRTPATYQGEAYPIYAVPIDGTTRNLMLVEKGREQSTFVDPDDPAATPIVWQGRWRTLSQAWTFAPADRQLHDGLDAAELPAAAVQHGGDRGPEHARGGPLVDRSSPTASPASGSRAGTSCSSS